MKNSNIESLKIDLRSDTVTKPTAEMKEIMNAAEIGDDVFGDDPTIIKLEEKASKMFGMQAALFCPTGTMTNQLAIRVHCKPGSEVICDKLSHIYLYEGGGIALNALSSVRTIEGNNGRITAKQVIENINNYNDIHQPITKMVSLENTVNKGGGSIYDFNEIKNIKKVCDQNDLILHLDGARLFNALVETSETTLDFGSTFHSISICLSKGLGCPVGSLLIGSKDLVMQARRYRKVMGGGWRQAGYLAAAGIFALDNNIQRLKDDHKRAREIGIIFRNKNYVKQVYNIQTNIVIVELIDSILATDFVAKLAEMNVYCIPFGKHLVRFVTHLDFNDNHLMIFEEKIHKIIN